MVNTITPIEATKGLTLRQAAAKARMDYSPAFDPFVWLDGVRTPTKDARHVIGTKILALFPNFKPQVP